MDVNEIFYSIEGEGIRAGMPCVFVRFNGCNLDCNYCDTLYAHEFTVTEDNDMSVEDIINAIKVYGCPNVTLTGGEPLLQLNIYDLIDNLAQLGYNVNVETNGSINVYSKGNSHQDNVIYTVDYKCISSGVDRPKTLDNYTNLCSKDVLKFVVSNQTDMDEAFRIIQTLKIANVNPHIYFSPVFGRIEPSEIAEFLKSHGLHNCKVQIQLHKILWDPTKRGV